MVHCIQINLEATDPENPAAYERNEDNAEVIQKARGFIKSLVQVGIPIFFYISGLATTFWNSDTKYYNQYVFQKFMRLMIPLFIAIPTVLVPRLYFAQEYQLFARPDQDNIDYIEPNFFKYMMFVLPTLSHKLSWLWFLPALFIDSNINYPLLVWSQRRSKGKPFEKKTDGGLIIGQVVMIFLWSIP
jgi:hypothetical protein